MSEPQTNLPPPPPPYYNPPREGTSGLAIASLVIAIVGFFLFPCAPLLAIPAVIMGHVAYARARRTGGAGGIAIAGFVVGYASLAFWMLLIPIQAAILLPALTRSREAAHRASCQNNLKQVGLMLKMYADEHNGAMPATFTELYPEYAADLSVFVCPSSADKPGDASGIDSWTSYEFTPPAQDSSAPALVVCRDKETNHIPPGRNELFADGHVAFQRGP